MNSMPASDNSAATFTPAEARTITANIVRLLDTKCIHLEGRDPAWQRMFAERRQDLVGKGTRRLALFTGPRVAFAYQGLYRSAAGRGLPDDERGDAWEGG